jgi:hypothetical protein
MPLNDHLSAASRNLALNAALDVLNSGFVRIYSGTQPATADTALSGNTLLAELTFSATAFAAATAGSKTANAITQDSSADATGTASFYRCFQSNGVTAVLDGSVGTASSNLILNTVSIVTAAAVSITSFVASMAA